MEDEKKTTAVRALDETETISNMVATTEGGCDRINDATARAADLQVFCERCDRIFSDEDIRKGRPICSKCLAEIVEKHRQV